MIAGNDREEIILLADGPVKVLISAGSAEEIIAAYLGLVVAVCQAAAQIEEILASQPGNTNDNPSEKRGRTH